MNAENSGAVFQDLFQETFDEFNRQGMLRRGPHAKYYEYKQYLETLSGVPVNNLWTDIYHVNPMAKEKLGYQTQKPLPLLERIIGVSTNPGDYVFDPFCGCGTTIHAAEKLGRKWIGIDVTILAIQLIQNRLTTAFSGKTDYEVKGIPKDYQSAVALATTDGLRGRYEFHIGPLGSSRGKLSGISKKKAPISG